MQPLRCCDTRHRAFSGETAFRVRDAGGQHCSTGARRAAARRGVPVACRMSRLAPGRLAPPPHASFPDDPMRISAAEPSADMLIPCVERSGASGVLESGSWFPGVLCPRAASSPTLLCITALLLCSPTAQNTLRPAPGASQPHLRSPARCPSAHPRLHRCTRRRVRRCVPMKEGSPRCVQASVRRPRTR